MTKLGRNDPCPCGSGRKYKQCCLTQDRAALELRERLVAFVSRPDWQGEVSSALELFWGPAGPTSLEEAEERGLIHFIDWFMHDYRLRDGRTLIEIFAQEQGPTLTTGQRRLLADWQHSLPGAYEVIQVRPGQGLRLRDILLGQLYEVRDISSSWEVRRWDVLITRIIRVGKTSQLSAAGWRLSPSRRAALHSFLLDAMADYTSTRPDSAYDEFLRASSAEVNQYVMGLFQVPAPQFVTTEGDPILFCTASYEVRDYPTALAALAAMPEMQRGVEEGEYDWVEGGESLEFLHAHGSAFEYQLPIGTKEGGSRILGHLVITPQELTLECSSERRLRAGKALLAKRLGPTVAHCADVRKEPSEVLQEKPPQASPETPAVGALEVARELREATVRDYYRDWLDQPIPVLGGRTPRQAVKTLDGRFKVIRLLKEIENLEARGQPSAWRAFDLWGIKSALGLTDDDLPRVEEEAQELCASLVAIHELAEEGEADGALALHRAFTQSYPVAHLDELDFDEVWEGGVLFADATAALAEALADRGRCDEGVALLEQMIALDEVGLSGYRCQIGEMLIEKGEIEQGTALLESLGTAEPDFSLPWKVLGYAYRDAWRRHEEAILYFRRALTASAEPKEKAEICQELFYTYLAMGRFAEAQGALEEMIRILGTRRKYHAALVEMYIAAQDPEQARKHLRAIRDADWRAYYRGLLAWMEGDEKGTRRAWRRLLWEPESAIPALWERWADIHLRLGEPEVVIARLPACLTDRLQAWPAGYLLMGIGYALKGDLAAAEVSLRRGKELLESRVRRGSRPYRLEVAQALYRDLHLGPEVRAAIEPYLGQQP